MGNLAIVAIPEDQDRVWKISSEKVPHLTLLFLGEAENNPNIQQIMLFVQHATALCEHGPFYLDVERRGTLGDDEADVIFFNKRSYNLKWIKQFRHQLLQNDAIRTAYNSTEQYSEWLPHLTLGYPQTPAKNYDDFESRLYSVAFDRIAVWTGDYEGPDFQLEWPEYELEGEQAVAYSDAQKAALTHYGVKGMRWGQRKTEAVTTVNFKKQELTTKQVTPKKAEKLDKKWEREVRSADTLISVYNDAATHVNSRIGAINDKFEKAHPKEMDDGTLLNPKHPVSQAYNKEYVATFKEGLNKSVSELSSSPTGKKRIKLVTANEDTIEEFTWTLDIDKVKHATDDTEEVVVYVVKRDVKGRVTDVQLKKDAMSQTAELGEEFLSHYGIKGMRWGVRNRRGEPLAVTPQGVSRVPHGNRRRTKVKTEGGENQPATEDAVRVAETKAKLKKSGVAALSNQELRDVAERIRLEEQAKELVQPKGKKFVKGLLKDQGTQTARTVVRETVEETTGIGGGGGKKKR